MTVRPPTISVAVPVYNGAATLSDCLDSITVAVHRLPVDMRGQVEVIVCDNHSSDESLEMIESRNFRCPTRIVQPPAHLANRTENWSYALAQCRGEWIQMLHADDALSEGAFTTWLEAVQSPFADGVGIVTARHAVFDDYPGDTQRLRPLFPIATVVSGRRLARWVLPLICPFVPFILLRREVFDRVGGLNPRYQLVQDWDLWRRMCTATNVLYWPALVGEWRKHATSAAYQRINMSEHLEMLAQLNSATEPAVPRPVRMLAARGTAARVANVLAADDTPEADVILKALTAHPKHERGWMRLTMLTGSAILNSLRLVGAVRARTARSRA